MHFCDKWTLYFAHNILGKVWRPMLTNRSTRQSRVFQQLAVSAGSKSPLYYVCGLGQYRDQGSTWCKVLRSSVVSRGHMVRRSRGVISNLNTCGQGVRSQSAGQGEKSVGFERQLLTVFVVNILRFERNGGKFLKRHFQMYFVGRNYWTLNWIRLKCVYVSLQ